MTVEGIGSDGSGANAWARAVEEGRALADQAQGNRWAIADLCLRLFPPRAPGQRAKGEERLIPQMQRWINETGLEYSVKTLRAARETAKAWPEGERVSGASFNTHELLNGHAERFSIIKSGMTASAALLAARRRRNNSHKQSFATTVGYLKASAGFLGTASKSFTRGPRTNEEAEVVGAVIAELEAALDHFLELAGMAEDEPLLELVAA